MPSEAINTAAEGAARTVRVQVLTPPGVLSRAGELQPHLRIRETFGDDLAEQPLRERHRRRHAQ